MTDTPIIPACPFCGEPLRASILDEPCAWYCPNHCIGTYEPKVWQALIDGKKAQDALFRIRDRVDEIEPQVMESLETCKIACDALAQIKDICESGRYADTLNFNLDSTDIRQIWELATSITQKNKDK